MKKIYFYDTDGKTRLDELVQWDINRKILVKASDINISDSPPEVHFSNENTKEAYVTETTISGDFVELTLPNKLMQQPFTLLIAKIFPLIFNNQPAIKHKTRVLKGKRIFDVVKSRKSKIVLPKFPRAHPKHDLVLSYLSFAFIIFYKICIIFYIFGYFQ